MTCSARTNPSPADRNPDGANRRQPQAICRALTADVGPAHGCPPSHIDPTTHAWPVRNPPLARQQSEVLAGLDSRTLTLPLTPVPQLVHGTAAAGCPVAPASAAQPSPLRDRCMPTQGFFWGAAALPCQPICTARLGDPMPMRKRIQEAPPRFRPALTALYGLSVPTANARSHARTEDCSDRT